MIKYYFFGKETGLNSASKQQEELLFHMKQCGFISKIHGQSKVLKPLLLNQIHSKEIVTIDSPAKIYDENSRPKADGIICNLPEVAIGVITADCSPVLLFDEKAKIIGAAHAGWRGAKLGILSETILAMKKLGAKEISAVIGPMIQQSSYEVSADFVDDFLREDASNSQFFLPLQKSALSLDSSDQKSLFDLPAYVEKKLNLAEVSMIKNLGIDTYSGSCFQNNRLDKSGSSSQEFFSYRRSCHLGQKNYGQNVAIISIL